MTKAADDFDLEAPELPKAIRKAALRSGNYPYDETLDDDVYEASYAAMQLQLVRLQAHLAQSGERIVVLFEGRDAAGKGGTIKRYLENLNPRFNIIAALPKPNDRERTQWYFQRYIDWMPAAGETVLFDRSWYNRAGVEPVMGFCTRDETERFLDEVPRFEAMLVNDGIRLFKFWLDIGREMQLKRFWERHHDELKRWKLSPVDLAALDKWDEYSEARDEMLRRSDSTLAPWTVILGNDKKRARLEVFRRVLLAMSYPGKDPEALGAPDDQIVMSAGHFLHRKRD